MMTDEKLKTAVREALEEFFQQKGSCSEECADFVASALSRRGVVVRGEEERGALAKLRAEFDNAKFNENLDSYDDLLNAVDRVLTLDHLSCIPPQSPPLPVFEVGKRYLSRSGDVWIITGPSNIEGYEFRAKRAEGPFSFMANGNYWDDGTPHENDLIPGALSDEPTEVFEVGKRYRTRDGVLQQPLRRRDMPTFIYDAADSSHTWDAMGSVLGDPNTPHHHDLIPGAIPDEPTLTPLTYEQACALPVGSEVVCLDVGMWGEKDWLILVKGKTYTIVRDGDRIDRLIICEKDKVFTLNKQDCHLFAAVPLVEKLGRFGHHPDPANDFCVEVEIIEALEYDVSVGRGSLSDLVSRTQMAMTFRVGGDEIAIKAKGRLRQIDEKLRAAVLPADEQALLNSTGSREEVGSSPSAAGGSPAQIYDDCARGLRHRYNSDGTFEWCDAERPTPPAPAMTDEEIGKHALEIIAKENHYGARGHENLGADLREWINAHASELFQAPADYDEEDLTCAYLAGAKDHKARAEKAEAALEALRREAEAEMRELPADQTYNGGVRQGLLMAVCAAGFIVRPEIPVGPAKPLRVEVGK
jgi:hypothetical protein